MINNNYVITEIVRLCMCNDEGSDDKNVDGDRIFMKNKLNYFRCIVNILEICIICGAKSSCETLGVSCRRC